MARRVKGERTVPPLFEAALSRVNQMERAVIYRTVEIDFTVDDLLEAFISDHVLAHLRAAVDHVQSDGGVWDVRFPLPSGMGVHLTVNHPPCVCPKDVTIDNIDRHFMPTPKAAVIQSTCEQIAEIVQRHDAVRRVIKWLDLDNTSFGPPEIAAKARATPGFARQYCPWLGSLLEPDHAFHNVSGQIYRDMPIPYVIRTDIRNAAAVVASGLLCDPNTHGHKEGRPKVQLQIERPGVDQRDVYQRMTLLT